MSKHATQSVSEPRKDGKPRRRKNLDPAYTLRLLREGLGLTQAEVAKRSGIAQGDVSLIERRADVKVSTLERYAEALGGKLQLRVVLGVHSCRIALNDDREEAPSPE